MAGTVIGAGSVLGTLKYSSAHNSSDEATAALIRERAAETQTLTPVAEIDLPLEQNETNELLAETESEPEQEAPLQPDTLESFTIKPRQNLSVVLKQGGLTNREIYLVSEALSDVLDLKKFRSATKLKSENEYGYGRKTLLLVTIEDRHGNRYTAARSEADFLKPVWLNPK